MAFSALNESSRLVAGLSTAALGTALGVAALSIAAEPAFAQAPAIAIQSCTVLQEVTTESAFWYPFGPAVPHGMPIADGIRIVYTNLNPIAADRVAFVVTYRGDTQRIVDTGTFSTNAAIDHIFGAFSGDAYLGPKVDACVATAARFIDGTSWRPSTRRLP
jgi:hypothetical protein